MLYNRVFNYGGFRAYTAPGTYTFIVPAEVTMIRAIVVGAGGGGGVGVSPPAGGAGGGGGAGGAVRASKIVSGGDTITIVIGTGGFSNGANGTTGESSTVTHAGNVLTGLGGGGGNGTPGAGGAGGSYTVGANWTFVAGQNGNNGSNGISGISGGAGGNFSAFFGVPAALASPGDSTGFATLAQLSAGGTNPASLMAVGGSGSLNRTFPTNYFGGLGGFGYVRLDW